MDNIIFTKIWEEENFMEVKIFAESEFASAYQNCYIQKEDLKKITEKICSYVKNQTDHCYLEFGKKEGNYTPAFSMDVLPVDVYGHVKIEVDIEINDNNIRAHRCCFYVDSELGLVETLGLSLKNLLQGDIGTEARLCR